MQIGVIIMLHGNGWAPPCIHVHGHIPRLCESRTLQKPSKIAHMTPELEQIHSCTQRAAHE